MRRSLKLIPGAICLTIIWLLTVTWVEAQAPGSPRAKRSQRGNSNSAGRSTSWYKGRNVGTDPAGAIGYRNTLGRPTVSPYLNLTRLQGINQVPQYQAVVRPQLEQRRTDRQTQRAISSLQRQARAPRAAREQSDFIRDTGHKTDFMTYSGFFGTIGSP